MELRPLKFIFHFGAGKTGTTSIQQTLKLQQDKLREHGFWYLGLMLEYVAQKKYDWQEPTTVNDAFHALPAEVAEQQLLDVLEPTLEQARASGIHTLIWSNESFFGRNAPALNALKKLRGPDLDVILLAYIRRHDAWARSAYIQWGIKHKTYPGPIQPFREWAKRNTPRFGDPLKAVADSGAGRLVLRNLDAVGDTLGDFISLCGMQQIGLSPRRANESPDGAEIYLRFLLNNQVKEKVLPAFYDHLVGRFANAAVGPGEHLASLLPADDDLGQLQARCADDRAKLDELLAQNNQPGIDIGPMKNGKGTQLDTDVLLGRLAQLAVVQATKIERLAREVERLSGQLEAMKGSVTAPESGKSS
ncbi:hypothetical protein [Nitrosomonas sp. Is37]|uniref:hypothetical protein n=1 Tax=Nitrosomonas sp. Is37 TaxID=3080535 RepID=UPI00294B3239|nr:hypothetical protein [Nitrosomonas sp. Is37]MDV6344911.1 hypothetical protein [Nitrosomonas sp. Is37]